MRFSPRIAVFLCVAAYAALLTHFIGACAGGSDTSGYLIQARQLSEGKITFPARTVENWDTRGVSDFVYDPLGAKPSLLHPGELVPTYPLGMPLMIAAAHLVTGWNRAFTFIILAHSILALWIVCVLGRELSFSPPWCMAAIALLATGPLYLQSSLQGMSDVPALVWNTLAAIAAWRARERWVWAILAGLALSVSVLVRPNDVLMIVPVIVAWWPSRWGAAEPGEAALGPDELPKAARTEADGTAGPASGPLLGLSLRIRGLAMRLLGMAAGGLPAGVAFCCYNYYAFGNPLETGYGQTAGLFAWNVIPANLRYYALWLPVLFTPLILLGFGLAWAVRRSRIAAFLAAWVIAYLAFFVSNRFVTQSWMVLRYILPAAPALFFGALWIVRWIFEESRLRASLWPRRAFAAALALAFAGQLVADVRLNVLYAGRGELTYPQAMAWMNANLPKNSILVAMQASGSAGFYTSFPVVRWDELNPDSFRRLAETAKAEGRPLYAPLFNFEKEQTLGTRLPGTWRPAGKVRQITVWRYEGP